MSAKESDVKHSHNYDPYLIGFGWDCQTVRRYWRKRDWFGVRYSLKRILKSARRRSWWGIWQMEWPGCQRAVRGLTYKQAYRRGIAGWTRDYERWERSE
jgi:hypothetical protein